MRHFIMKLLIITILCQGIGWASDFHDETLFGHETSFNHLAHDAWPSSDHSDRNSDNFGNNSGNSENQDTGSPSCDHCCHGAVHLTGMTASPLVVADFASEPQIHKLDTRYCSFTHSPPTPPPNT